MATEAQHSDSGEATDTGLWSRMVFLREANLEGSHGWAVFDADGDIIFHDPSRSSAWFFITSNDLRAMPRH